MDEHQRSTAIACLAGAANNSMSFPHITATLLQAGFEGYTIDFRRAIATFSMPAGDSLDLEMHRVETPVAPAFDATAVRAAVADAQRLVPGYTYRGFCERIVAAGCASYLVSFSGRRVLYIGRTAETHVERFPT